MTSQYLIGVFLGLLGGVLTQGGLLLQKKAVNDISGTGQERYFRRLLGNRLWMIGLVIGVGGGSLAYAFAQSLIGPAIVPGLMAIGLIVLAVGSVRLNGEHLNRSEIVAIFIMISGIFFIGLSRLQITSTQVRTILQNPASLMRIIIFTGSYFLLFFIARGLVSVIKSHRGTFIALGNGFLFAQNDFWINPLIATIFIVLGGKGTTTQVIIFFAASLILVSTSIVTTWQTQLAFRYGQASNLVPVEHVAIQLSPIIVYFVVFALPAPSTLSILSAFMGVVMTTTAGFLLGRRKEVLAGQPLSES